MGPFPHDAPPATITSDNPMGTDGFEFVEYAHPHPDELHALFKLMGFTPVARHKTKRITVYPQGDINYLVNEEPATHGYEFVAAHGPCAPSMAFRVVDAEAAYDRAIALGAEPADVSPMQKTLDVPAIKGIGGSLLYLVDRYGAKAFDVTVTSTDVTNKATYVNFLAATANGSIFKVDSRLGGVHMSQGRVLGNLKSQTLPFLRELADLAPPDGFTSRVVKITMEACGDDLKLDADGFEITAAGRAAAGTVKHDASASRR